MEHSRLRVIAGVSGSAGSLRALRRAVTEARLRDAALYSVIAWIPQGGEVAYARAPCPPLLAVWRDAAMRRMRAGWDEALGGVPPDLDAQLITLRGPAGPRLVQAADRDTDLLVIGAATAGLLDRLTKGSVTRYCVARASCAVLVVPPTPLQRQAAHHPFFRRRILRELTRDSGH